MVRMPEYKENKGIKFSCANTKNRLKMFRTVNTI